MKTQYMGIDCTNGHTFHGLVNPRKDLCDRLGFKHADKMYRDDKDGNAIHIGYIIGGHWIEVYEVKE